MLHAGLDLSRKRLDFQLLDEAGVTVEVGAAPPDVTACMAWSRACLAIGSPYKRRSSR